MEHILFKQKVKNDAVEDYINEHKNASHEFLKAFGESGIKRAIVWRDKNNNDLFVYMLTDDFKKSMSILINKEIHKKWIAKMEPLLAEIQDYSNENNINSLEKIFDVEEQLLKF